MLALQKFCKRFMSLGTRDSDRQEYWRTVSLHYLGMGKVGARTICAGGETAVAFMPTLRLSGWRRNRTQVVLGRQNRDQAFYGPSFWGSNTAATRGCPQVPGAQVRVAPLKPMVASVALPTEKTFPVAHDPNLG